MTSPPLSEGPSPEAGLEKAIEEIRAYYRSLVTTSTPREILTDLIAAAKRSAHLEAARALCEGCKREGAPHHPPNRIRPGPDDWWHDNHIRCYAGVVWDALSLPPSGTIKSTASEQPDGKTR